MQDLYEETQDETSGTLTLVACLYDAIILNTGSLPQVQRNVTSTNDDIDYTSNDSVMTGVNDVVGGTVQASNMTSSNVDIDYTKQESNMISTTDDFCDTMKESPKSSEPLHPILGQLHFQSLYRGN